jgi:phosphohistidine phosphatase
MSMLFLLRHASAAGAGPTGDHSRPLSARGRDDAGLIGRHLAAQAMLPAMVLCSSAERAVETWNIVAAQLPDPQDAAIDRALYSADAGDILAMLHEAPEGTVSVLVVGHNPTLHQLAFSISAQHECDALNRLARDFPPGALAQIDISDTAWADLGAGTGRLVSLVAPGDLL